MSKFNINNPAWLQCASMRSTEEKIVIASELEDPVIMLVGSNVTVISVKNDVEISEYYEQVGDDRSVGEISIQSDPNKDIVIKGDVTAIAIALGNGKQYFPLYKYTSNIKSLLRMAIESTASKNEYWDLHKVIPNSTNQLVISPIQDIDGSTTFGSLDLSNKKILAFASMQFMNPSHVDSITLGENTSEIAGISPTINKLDISLCDIIGIGTQVSAGARDIIGLENNHNIESLKINGYEGESIYLSPSLKTISLKYCDNIELIDISNCVSLSNISGELQSIREIRAIAINADVANGIKSFIANSNITNGIVYLRTNDEYNSVIADAATTKGWTVEYV